MAYTKYELIQCFVFFLNSRVSICYSAVSGGFVLYLYQKCQEVAA